jgi:N utilization substance protein B
MRGESPDGAINHFYDTLYSEEQEAKPKPDKFMEELVRGTVARAAMIDRQIEAKATNWRLERMPVVDRNILRLAVYELTQNEVPPLVIIDEAMALARQFSNDESITFINGILDAIHKQVLASSAPAQLSANNDTDPAV